ncbi:MAG: helix-turn-helix transcriptional regulator [Clostridia bacterium]|nr:helix-turn-helix transcriptional regulator [Clostridia bacterium]
MNEMKNILMERMADNLPVLRKKAELTQTALAELIGVSKFTILSIEKKQRKMTWNTFLSLVLVFTKNKETDKMLTLFEIYTDEFNEFIKNRDER